MRTRTDRGFTLIELVVAAAISAILVVLVVNALVALSRDQSSREAVIFVQGEARLGIGFLEQDLRSGSLGAGTGVVTAGATTSPMIQIYDNVAGGFLGAKPGTDALLVVEALEAPRVAAAGDHYGGNVLTVTALSGGSSNGGTASFAVNDAVLFGEYGNAGWARVTEIDPGRNQLKLDAAIVRMGGLGPEQKLPSGSMVRRARARLYYVDARDQLVRAELRTPAPPAAAADVIASEVVATSFENLQLDLTVDPNVVPAASTCAVAGAEANAALAPSSGRLSVACMPSLRTISVNAVVHGKTPLRDIPGDDAVTIGGQNLSPAGAAAGDAYVRRTYQLQVAVRNTSLEVL